ncbi:hypothetical protein JEY40_24540 [Bradyrhizobium japonicum]|uniref:hypothetical protein n=1 Tax=Bradyrhizobium japonicum TaxID=375 RepID=UPI00200E1C74|nr:hypothetical protein [Bradyrhizobium japonicum]UQD69187.1 hypothetical protein JEY40_24540 [Bradyrhizobium japonicum]WAX24449.1 hypothetical protein [Bradyrhizobium phage ppBjS10J-1]
MKATDQMMRQDMRRLRIQPLLHEILHIVGKHLSDEDYRRNALRDLHNELFDKFHEMGIEIVSDHMRAAMGLPARGPDGWTVEELIALEQKRIEMLTRPIQLVVPGQER